MSEPTEDGGHWPDAAPSAYEPFPASQWPRYHYRGWVRRIIDGDTLEVLLDLGDRTFRIRRIRLLGFDAPELFRGDDREAGAAARDALATIAPVDSIVYLRTELDRESFDRLLGWAYVADSDSNLYSVAEAMKANGFTTA